MKSLARIIIVACFCGLSFAGLWWLIGQIDPTWGFPGASTFPPWLVGCSAGLLAGCGEAWRIFIEQRNVRKNREVAEGLGCEFAENVSPVVIRSWPQVSLLSNDSPSGSNRMIGTYNGREVDVFDFSYTITSHSSGEGSSSSTSTYVQTVYRFPQTALNWPCLLLKPRRRLIGFLSSMLGATEAEISPPEDASDQQIAMFEGFQKRYQITVPDETESPRELQRLFHPVVVGWLATHPGWNMESKEGDLVAWKSGTRVVGDERLLMLSELSDLISLMEAANSALDRNELARMQIHSCDRASGFSGFVGMWFGAMTGIFAGGMVGALVASEVFALMPDKTLKFAVVVPVFLGIGFVSAVLGGYLGLRLGRRSALGRRLFERIAPLPNVDSSEECSTDT